MAVARDVTERVRTEDALRRSEQKFAFHVQQMPLAAIGDCSGHDCHRLEPRRRADFRLLGGGSRREKRG